MKSRHADVFRRWRLVFAVSLSALALSAVAVAGGFTKSFNLGRLGQVDFVVDSRYDSPVSLVAGQRGQVSQKLEVWHKLSSGYKFSPIFVRAEASAIDIGSLHVGDNELARLKVDFGGLLLSGLPHYLQENEGAFFRDNQIDFQTYRDSTSHATLTRSVKVKIDSATIRKLADFDLRLHLLELRIGKLQSRPTSDPSRTQLFKLRSDYFDLKTKKFDILHQMSQIEVPCFPPFKERVKFPIWEKGSSGQSQSKGSSGSASGSASAKLGVSGDVDVTLTPHCHIDVGLNANLEAYVVVDVLILSHGFFGARADASADISVEFYNGELGKYVPLGATLLGKEELDILRQLLHDAVYSVKDAQTVNDALLKAVSDAEAFADLRTAILTDLIGTPTNPASTDKLCKLFRTRGVLLPGSPEDLICKGPPPIPIPAAPKVACNKAMFDGVCTGARTVNLPYPPHCRGPIRPPDCNAYGVHQIPELPPGCSLNASICREWASLSDRVRQAQEQERRRVSNIVKDLAAKGAQLANKSAQLEQKRHQNLIYETARTFAEANILNAAVSEAVASKIIDAAWDAGEKGEQQIDLISGIVKPEYLRYLTIHATGTARLAFQSTAYILKASPAIEDTVGYCGGDKNAAGDLCRTISFYQHRNKATKPRAAALDVLGFTFEMQSTMSVVGQQVTLKPVRYQLQDKTTIEAAPNIISTRPDSQVVKMPLRDLIPTAPVAAILKK